MNPFRILIAGSCVSRDIMNYDTEHAFELSAYYARSSFASAFATVKTNDRFSQNIKSKFQAAVVNADLEKHLQQSLAQTEFDILLVDLIDERFNIFCESSGGIFTLSNELFSGGFNSDSGSGAIIKAFSDDFYNKWVCGWRRFISQMKTTNQLHKVIIHKTFWSTFTQTGNTYAPHFTDVQINTANHFLQRLYNRAAEDVPDTQFIEPLSTLLQGADEHKWGVSPFHYIDDYYSFMLEKIKSLASIQRTVKTEPSMDSRAVTLLNPDRSIESGLLFTNSVDNNHRFALRPDLFKGNAKTIKTASGLKFIFENASETHQVRFKLPIACVVDGLNVRFKISEWQSLNYLAIGYVVGSDYHHVKIVHTLRDQWVDFSLGYSDLAFGIQNNWQRPPASEALEVKLFFKGRPLPQGSTLEIEEIACWKENSEFPFWLDAPPNYPAGNVNAAAGLEKNLVHSTYTYLGKCFRDVGAQVTSFLSDGTCPLYGNKNLPWPSDNRLPDTLGDVGTYRFSWHALHPATMMMMHARTTGNLATVFSARDFINQWLDHSYFSNDPDKKFAWYDHGTAERLLSLILMCDLGAKYQFDTRFMTRLRGAIFKHAQLLSSEMFYSSHQVSRYHNHAWFQDVALLAAALALPELPCAQLWTTTALKRLEDQLEKLIIRDNGYAVFIENSIGYHQGVQRLLSFAGELALLSGRPTDIPAIANELIRFSELLKYPDNRAPAQGDTFRRKNPGGRPSFPPKPYKENNVTLLPKAGYAIIKGNHEDRAYMLSMFATSLCQTHKHEDNLSFTLFMDGIEWLIDPSFYSHEYAKPLQKFLRSAWAHNNVVAEGHTYSILPGKAELSGTSNESCFTLAGRHTAYENLEVSRRISGDIDQLNFTITDCVTGNTHGNTLSLFHCGDGVTVNTLENAIQLSHPASDYHILITSECEVRVVNGWLDERDINAVTGLGFMEDVPTSVVAYTLPQAQASSFSITASKVGSTYNPQHALQSESKK